jgi:phosphoribosylformimino-5-aminoimidazole carboxamide ribotide isomerase
VDVPVEVGGGLRTASDIQELLDAGIARVILGTRACEKPDDLVGLVEQFGSRLAVGIDARKGDVQVRGWTKGASISPVDLAMRVDAAGVKTLIYTDTAVDGMLTGPNASSTDEICSAVSCDVIASGGVASADDVRALGALGRENLTGVIVGKALYEKKVSVKALIDATTESG